MDNCRPGETPMDQSVVLYPGASEEALATRVPYKQAVGALLYLSRVTRPDIAFAVNQVAAHAARPTVTHWHAVKKILRYVWGTRSMALVYQRDVHAPRIKVYTDADSANNILDRKSISGVLAQVHGCTVHWSCKRQTVVAKSSTAAEFISCSMGVEEVIWIRMFLSAISGVHDTSKIPVLIDKKSTIHRILNGKTFEAQKTIDVMFHAIKDTYNNGCIRLEYCPTTTMLADGLTKALGVKRFLDHRTQIGLAFKDSTAELRGSVVATSGGTQINSESSAE
ncbi:hypothetical protein PF008_g4740 [Phytophthora fragariae]|uniref:Reverse transcriptase Ty1/copia-type domain-containing protein n=1 Tax=Phytophthora fragariae TaxID=53985 RepID=A0A6G0SAZ9_9STRA|nr:hypothetical protein PF008_g4740 [Phytophthora fragariae]